MSSEHVVYVGENETTVCCRGGADGLGHPAVYLTYDGQDCVHCYYCGCKFKRGRELADQEAKVSKPAIESI